MSETDQLINAAKTFEEKRLTRDARDKKLGFFIDGTGLLSPEEDMPSQMALAASYVKLRENYHYFSLQHEYDTVQLFASGRVNDEYRNFFNSQHAPDTGYQNAAHVVNIEIISHVISVATDLDKLAQICSASTRPACIADDPRCFLE